MKLLIYSMILILSIIAGLYLKSDPGLLHLEYQSWSLDMPLWLSIIMLALTFFITIIVVEIMLFIFRIPYSLYRWLDNRLRKNANRATQNALLNFFIGNYKKANKLSEKASNSSSYPIITHILAAESAQEMSDFEERKKHISKLRVLSSNNKDEVEFLAAKLDFDARDFKAAEQKLQKLCKNSQIAPNCYKILIEIYKIRQSWEQLRKLLPLVKKYNVLDRENYIILFKYVYKKLLKQYIIEQDNQTVFALWKQLPIEYRADSELLELYVYFLCRIKEFTMAENELKFYLKKELNNNLLMLFVNLKVDCAKKNTKKIEFLEKLLEKDLNNAYLLLALGKLCVKEKLWGKAKDYFIASNSSKPLPETYLELANLSNLLNETEAANKYYKEGFLLTSKMFNKNKGNLDI